MKILILSASTGGGHMTASNALKACIIEDKNNNAEIVDTLEYISPILNKTVVEGYHYMALKAPKLFGAVYSVTNKENPLTSFVFYLNNLFSKKLLPLLDKFNPSVIVTTHPFPTEMVSNLKKMGKVAQPLVCIITDYAPHKTWLNGNVDEYIVSNEDMIDEMVNLGIRKSIIHPFGIPIDKSFYEKTDRNSTLAGLDLDPNLKTILVMAGSMGATQIFKLYKKIVSINLDFQIIVITGNNRALYKSFKRLLNKKHKNTITDKIKKIKVKGYKTISALKINDELLRSIMRTSIPDFMEPQQFKPTKLIFFTSEVHKYMQAADLIITKPGGLTISEALACKVPMVLFNAIPGQEEENAEFLIRNNMAIELTKSFTPEERIKQILSDPEELISMKNSFKSFDKSSSKLNIISLLSSLSGEINDSKKN